MRSPRWWTGCWPLRSTESDGLATGWTWRGTPMAPGKVTAGLVFLGDGMARDGYANTWRYRDWVIQALNADMPYDRFVKAQIAAGLMPAPDRSKLLPALGYFGIGPWFTGDDVVFVEARANERDDKIDALTKGFLGLTVTCAGGADAEARKLVDEFRD